MFQVEYDCAIDNSAMKSKDSHHIAVRSYFHDWCSILESVRLGDEVGCVLISFPEIDGKCKVDSQDQMSFSDVIIMRLRC